MSILSTLQNHGGCAGGQLIYYGAKGLCLAKNVQRKRRELWPDTIKIMNFLLPHVNLHRVRFCINCSLPGNWFTSANNVEATTFGYTIFFDNSDYQKSWPGLEILLHELVHVDQVRRRSDSESAFACDYGKGYLAAGNYRNNPMEVEAYDFVTNHPLPGSLPANLQKLPKKP
nr:DUF4157 domain-containing protein [Nitrospirota bacterium]